VLYTVQVLNNGDVGKCSGVGCSVNEVETIETKTAGSGRDTIVALPSGYRKSVIFAVLPLLFDKLLGMYNCSML